MKCRVIEFIPKSGKDQRFIEIRRSIMLQNWVEKKQKLNFDSVFTTGILELIAETDSGFLKGKVPAI